MSHTVSVILYESRRKWNEANTVSVFYSISDCQFLPFLANSSTDIHYPRINPNYKPDYNSREIGLKTIRYISLKLRLV